jgi:hypothetical protein
VAATIVLIPGSPLGLLTAGVQTLAGVLLPSASVFLLLLCNDKDVLGPWVNGRRTNLFTSAVVAVLVALSIVLTASVVFPDISAASIYRIMETCAAAGCAVAVYTLARRSRVGVGGSAGAGVGAVSGIDRTGRDAWRMPPLAQLSRPVMSRTRRIGMGALRAYLAVAMVLVIIRLVDMALSR